MRALAGPGFVLVVLLTVVAAPPARADPPLLIVVEPGAVTDDGGGALVVARVLTELHRYRTEVTLMRPRTAREWWARDTTHGRALLPTLAVVVDGNVSTDALFGRGGPLRDLVVGVGPSRWARTQTFLGDIAPFIHERHTVVLVLRTSEMRTARAPSDGSEVLDASHEVDLAEWPRFPEPATWVEIDPRPERAAAELCVAHAVLAQTSCFTLVSDGPAPLALGRVRSDDRVVIVSRDPAAHAGLEPMAAGVQGAWRWAITRPTIACGSHCQVSVQAPSGAQVAWIGDRAEPGRVALVLTAEHEDTVLLTLDGSDRAEAAREIEEGMLRIDATIDGRPIRPTGPFPVDVWRLPLPRLAVGRHGVEARLSRRLTGDAVAQASLEIFEPPPPVDFGLIHAGDPPRCRRVPEQLDDQLLDTRTGIRFVRDERRRLCALAPLATLDDRIHDQRVGARAESRVHVRAAVRPCLSALAVPPLIAFLLAWLVFWLADVRPWRGRVTALAVRAAPDTAGFRDAARPQWVVRTLAEIEPELAAAGVALDRTTEGLFFRAQKPLVIARPSGRAWARATAGPLRAWTILHDGTHTWLALDAREAERVSARALEPDLPPPEQLRAWLGGPVTDDPPSRAAIVAERTISALVLAVLVAAVPWVTASSTEYGQAVPTLLAVATAIVALTGAFAYARLRTARALLG